MNNAFVGISKGIRKLLRSCSESMRLNRWGEHAYPSVLFGYLVLHVVKSAIPKTGIGGVDVAEYCTRPNGAHDYAACRDEEGRGSMVT